MCREFLIKWCRVCLSKVSPRTVATDLPGHEATYSSEPKNTVVRSQLSGLSSPPSKHNKSSHTPDINLVKKSGGKKNTWHTPLESLFMTLSQRPNIHHLSPPLLEVVWTVSSVMSEITSDSQCTKKYIWKCVMKAGIRQRKTAPREKT